VELEGLDNDSSCQQDTSNSKGAFMKRHIFAVLLVFLTMSCFSYAADLTDIEKHHSCTQCGMDREKFAQSRILIEYDDGTSLGACSLHCAAVDLANTIDKTPMYIGVGDYYSKQLIDAEKAFWVVGGGKPGVMTATPKWAFASRLDADKFLKENGGTLANFDEAISAAYKDMYRDTKQIRERRKMKKSHQPKG
jgi:copper chaperone NosL